MKSFSTLLTPKTKPPNPKKTASQEIIARFSQALLTFILKNAFKPFLKFYNQHPIKIKPKSKENQFFQPLFLRTRYFCLILNF